MTLQIKKNYKNRFDLEISDGELYSCEITEREAKEVCKIANIELKDSIFTVVQPDVFEKVVDYMYALIFCKERIL